MPVVAPVGTVAVTLVAELTVKTVAAVALNFTALVPSRLVPVMVTTVPTGPVAGLMAVMVGMASVVTTKSVPLRQVPAGVVTTRRPVVAVAGMVAVIEVAELVTNEAVTPLNVRAVTPMKLVPVSITTEPGEPLSGANEVIVGA